MTKAKIISKNVSLNDFKQKKKDELSNACGNTIVQPYQSQIVLESTGQAHVFGVDPYDQLNMQSKLVLMLSDRSVVDLHWKTVNGVVELTREEFIAIVKEIGGMIEQNRMKLVALKISVDNATTEEQVNSIVW